MKNYTSPVVALLGSLLAVLALALHPDTKANFQSYVDDMIYGNIEYFAYGIGFFVVFSLGLSRVFPLRDLNKKRSPKWAQMLSSTNEVPRSETLDLMSWRA